MKLSAVVFDFNGTLFWDTSLHNEAWDIYLGRFGIAVSDSEKHERFHGSTSTEILSRLFGESRGRRDIERMGQEKEALYRQIAVERGMRLADGAEELFGALQERAIPFTIATASDKRNVDFFVREFRLERWFDVRRIVYSDGRLRGKPHPDIFLKAAALIGVPIEECVVFEDSMSGIEAARRARAGFIYIVNSNGERYDGIDLPVISSFREVDLSLFGS